MTIQIKATGIVLNPRCPASKNPQYPPRTYFYFQTEAHGKLSFNIQHDHMHQLKDLGLRAVTLNAEVRGTDWQGNQRLEVLKMKIEDVVPESNKQPA